MTANEEIGKLIVKIVADSEELQDGLEDTSTSMDKVDKSAKKTDNAFGDVQDSSDDAAKSLKNAGDSADDASSDLDDVTDSLKREATAADRAEQSTDGVNTQIKKTGSESKDAKGKTGGFVDELKGVKVAGIGVVAALTAIVAGLIQVGTAAKNAADDVEASMRSIAISTGAQGLALEQYNDVVDNLAGAMGNTRSEIASTVGAVATLNADLNPDEVEALSEAYLHLGNVWEVSDYAGLVDDVDKAFKKWGIDAKDQAGMMDYLTGVVQTTNVPLETLVSTLADGDRGYQLMGLSAKQAAAYIGSAYAAGELSDATAIANAVEMLQAQKATSADTDANTYIQDIFDAAGAYDTQTAAVAGLSDEYGLSKDAAKQLFAAVNDGSTSYDTLTESIRTLQTEIKATDDLQTQATLQQQIKGYQSVLDAMDAIKEAQTSVWASDESSEAYIQSIFAVASAMDDESAAVAYLTGELGISYRVVQPFAAAMFSTADSVDDVSAAVDALNVSISDLDTAYETSAQRQKRMAENTNELLAPFGMWIQQQEIAVDRILQMDAGIEQASATLDQFGWMLGPGGIATTVSRGVWSEIFGALSDVIGGLSDTADITDDSTDAFDDLNTSLSDNATYLYGTSINADLASTSLTNMGGPIDTVNTKLQTMITNLQTAISLQSQLGVSSGKASSGSGSGAGSTTTPTVITYSQKITVNEARTPIQTAKSVSKEIARNAASGLLR